MNQRRAIAPLTNSGIGKPSPFAPQSAPHSPALAHLLTRNVVEQQATSMNAKRARGLATGTPFAEPDHPSYIQGGIQNAANPELPLFPASKQTPARHLIVGSRTRAVGRLAGLRPRGVPSSHRNLHCSPFNRLTRSLGSIRAAQPSQFSNSSKDHHAVPFVAILTEAARALPMVATTSFGFARLRRRYRKRGGHRRFWITMSTIPSTPHSEYWARHFGKLASVPSRRGPSRDQTQTPVAVQTYAFLVEACGSIRGKHILDCGFGTGELARILDLLGGMVDAIDLVKERIPQLREETPSVYWSGADLSQWRLPSGASPYDLIVACEVLQFVDFDYVVGNLIDALSVRGRLMIIIPNADCATVQSVSQRFQHRYAGISGTKLRERFARYGANIKVSYRGIRFRDDQAAVPFWADPWRSLGPSPPRPMGLLPDRKTPPHRLQLVVTKLPPVL